MKNYLLLKNKVGYLKPFLTGIMLFAIFFCYGQFAGGDGTENNPWQVETAQHLNTLREYLGADNNNRYYIQTANINLGVEPWNEGAGWTPIGNAQNSFRGQYNGRGFTISGLTISPPAIQQYSGLFGHTEGARISNVVLTGVNISNVGYRSAPLVGALINTIVENCNTSGNLSAGNGNQIAGLAGVAVGSQINNCWTNINYTTQGSWQGGLVGTHMGGSIARNSFSIGNITSTAPTAQNIGGLLGMNTGGVVVNCYSTSNVTTPAGNMRIGGLIGRNLDATVTNSYATGRVSNYGGANQEGGLIGGVAEGVVNNSYWNTESTGLATSAGGQAKTTMQMLTQATFNEWDFDEIWNIGYEGNNSYPWLQHQEAPGSFNYPVLQPPSGIVTSITSLPSVVLLWDAPSFGEPNEYRIYRNDEYLDSVDADETEFVDRNVQTLTTYRYQLTAVYGEDESERSAVVRATPVPGGFPSGTGFADNPYEVATVNQLNYIRYNPFAHYVLTDDIDLAGIENWQPIGSVESETIFSGSLNGNGHVISSLTVNRPAVDNVGLFGQVGLGALGATIRNLILEDVDISGRHFVGGLAGRINANTVIDSCWVSGEIVSAGNYTGGFVGYAVSSEISHSYSDGLLVAAGNFVGGFIGYNFDGRVSFCYARTGITGGRYVGGFVGYHRGRIINSYATESVTGRNTEIGGFAGLTTAGDIISGYSSGRVTAPQGAANVGGFIGQHSAGTITSCYWDTESSGQAESAAGDGRLTRQMTYPYDQQTYIDWDFEDIWRDDPTRRMNNGYPFLWWQPIETGPNPDIATNPQPQHQAANISVDLENVRWSYNESVMFTNPVGFRVYMNTTGEFGENAPYVWVPFEEDQANYATSEVLPEELAYRTTYHWKVVPTTIDPDGRGDDNRRRNVDNRSALDYRGDAENVPVWRFTTEINPNPTAATNPNPADDAEDVDVDLTALAWTYTINQNHANPAGFRVYLNTTGEFGEQDEFGWVAFSQHQSNYNISSILPEMLDYATTYYWKVVPTTNMPNRNDDRRRLPNAASSQRYGQNSVLSLHRGDAESVPVWSFTTILRSPNPANATNPQPEHLATGISPSLTSISWDYISSDIYADPAGFRVYMNTTGAFGANAPYEWVDFVAGEETYDCTEVVPTPLDANTTYFWRVIPTTIHPTRADSRNRNESELERSDALTRGDAPNSPVWRFTTGATDVEAIHELPGLTELQRNYPNPFNPETTISFSIAEAGEVVVEVYNSRGQQTATLVKDNLSAGAHTVVWNGRDNNNREVGSGIYFYRMKSGSYTSTNKMILLR